MTLRLSLVEFLQLDRTGPTTWSAPVLQDNSGRVFGGQIAAHSLLAAAASSDGATSSAITIQFVRPCIADAPITYRVAALKEGKRFHRLRVVSSQDGALCTDASVMLCRWQPVHPLQYRPRVSEPFDDDVVQSSSAVHPNTAAIAASAGILLGRAEGGSFEHDLHGLAEAVQLSLVPPFWEAFSDGLAPGFPDAVLTYLSDLAILRSLSFPFEDGGPRHYRYATLSHSVWFHQPMPSETELHYVYRPLAVGDGIGLARGEFCSSDGELLATTMQHGLIEQRAPMPLGEPAVRAKP